MGLGSWLGSLLGAENNKTIASQPTVQPGDHPVHLDQQHIAATIHQAPGRQGESVDQLVVADIPSPRVVHVGGDGAGLVRGPSTPATKRGFSGVQAVHASAASLATRAPARLMT